VPAALTKEGVMGVNGFLDAVVPHGGHYCSAGIKGGRVQHAFVDSIDELIKKAEGNVERSADAYFALASFRTPTRRKADNAQLLKSLWLDVDCGEGKPFKTKGEGTVALKKFIKEYSLPKPWVVDSGRGLHVYWALSEALSPKEWEPLAEGLKLACVKAGFETDPTVIADAARILRVPGTFNFKDSPPAPVKLVVEAGETDAQTFRDVLPKAPPARKKLNAPTRELDETSRRLIEGDSQSRFSTIVKKSLKGSGCAQVRGIVVNQEVLEEPIWRAGLSIAVLCVDRDKAIHNMSNKHPEYDALATISKANLTKGPATCAWFRANYPAACDGCKQKITSPIQLGREFARSAEPDVATKKPDMSSLFADAPVEEVEETKEEPVAFSPPRPYFRGKSGGVYIEVRDPDSGEKEERLVYEHDLYVTKRIFDPTDGETFVMKHVLPMDGVREFAVPLKTAQATEKFKEVLSTYGVAAPQKQMQEIMMYTTKFVKELQMKQKAMEARSNFGWCDDGRNFLVGDTCFTPKGEEYNPPSSYTRQVADWLQPMGELDKWKEAITRFTSGSQERTFAVLIGMAAPLMKYSGLQGVTISFVSSKSGTGKTLSLAAINSFWGAPDKLMLTEQDTINAQRHRMGVMSSLPVTIDEITNMKGEDLSDHVYGTSQGRGRNRLMASANMERVNTTGWETMLATTSNASSRDKLGAHKARADGEMMRLIEIFMNDSVADGRELYKALMANHGVAGRIYADWMLKNAKRLPDMVDAGFDFISAGVGHRDEERFWVGAMGLIYAVAPIANELYGFNFDLGALNQFIHGLILDSRSDVSNHIVSHASALGNFINANINGVLVINTTTKDRFSGTLVVKPATQRIVARVEAENGLMFISKKALRDYCAIKQVSLADLLAGELDMEYQGTVKKRMATGTDVVSPAVDAFKFDISDADLAEMLPNDA